eukprot:751026-Hanusia_phi.AAC.3
MSAIALSLLPAAPSLLLSLSSMSAPSLPLLPRVRPSRISSISDAPPPRHAGANAWRGRPPRHGAGKQESMPGAGRAWRMRAGAGRQTETETHASI